MNPVRSVAKRVRSRVTRGSGATSHVVATSGRDGATALLCSVSRMPGIPLRADSNGLVRLMGWSASPDDIPHRITITREGREQYGPRMARRPDFAGRVRRSGHPELATGTIRAISLFLHVPESETERSFDITVTAGDHSCHLGTFRVVRPKDAGRKKEGHTRARYKEVWNSVSGTLDLAKTAVAGYVDEDEFQRTSEATVLTLQRTTGLKPTDVVLEIGAGVGRVGPSIAPLCRKWIATDVSEQMLMFARERNSGFDNIEYVPLSGWDLEPIEDSSVDLVYCTVVFMHLDEWERYNYVREAFRVLRPGGRVYVDNYNLLSTPGWDFFSGVIQVHHPLNRPPNVSRSSTPEELQTYLERAGFENAVSMGPDEALFCWAYATKPTG